MAKEIVIADAPEARCIAEKLIPQYHEHQMSLPTDVLASQYQRAVDEALQDRDLAEEDFL